MTSQNDEPARDDAWLDAVLMDGAHVDDAGFTDMVLARLPAPRKRRARREIAIGCFALAAGAVGALAVAHGSLATFETPVGLMAVVVVGALALWGALSSADA